MDVRRYADLFLSESREHLTAFNQLLLQWERDPAAREPVDGIFRALHSLKSMAAAMGYGGVADLAHRVENLLDVLRRGAPAVTPEQLDLLFRAADALEVGAGEAVAGRDPGLADARLAAELDGEVARADPGGAPAAGPRPSGPAAEAAPEATPARHIRVDLRRLDGLTRLIGELAIARSRLVSLSRRVAVPELDGVTRDIERLSESLHREIIEARMVPVWQVFDRFPRVVRDLAKQMGRQVAFRVEGKEIELDRAILEEMADPLMHLLRNAVDHGIEPPEERAARGKEDAGQLVLAAMRERSSVAIRVSDDGRGIDRAKVLRRARELGLAPDESGPVDDDALFRLIAQAGFTTAERVTDVSGRGVGIDVVTTAVRAVGGSLEMRSEEGRGTAFTIRLPATVAMPPATSPSAATPFRR
jgi:two-component system chemotaxis sensor kinase CheA